MLRFYSQRRLTLLLLPFLQFPSHISIFSLLHTLFINPFALQIFLLFPLLSQKLTQLIDYAPVIWVFCEPYYPLIELHDILILPPFSPAAPKLCCYAVSFCPVRCKFHLMQKILEAPVLLGDLVISILVFLCTLIKEI